MDTFEFKRVATYEGQIKQKFGAPRQARLVENLPGEIVFEKEYWDMSALKGLENTTHLWLIWVFSENEDQNSFQATVRPPRLGGSKRMGVWATRSPNRPNRLGMSVVKLESFAWEEGRGPVLKIRGADLVSGTPILDIKPYIANSDSIPEASAGLLMGRTENRIKEIIWEKGLAEKLSKQDRENIEGLLYQDPRPAYQDYEDRVYGMLFAAYDIKFRVDGGTLYIVDIIDVPEAEV